MSPDEGQEAPKTGPLGFFSAFSERILESRTRSNMLIIVLIVLIAIPFLVVGIMATNALAPIDRIIQVVN